MIEKVSILCAITTFTLLVQSPPTWQPKKLLPVREVASAVSDHWCGVGLMKNKVEMKLKEESTRAGWMAGNKMIGHVTRSHEIGCVVMGIDDDFNKFYVRFDVHDMTLKWELHCSSLSPSNDLVVEKDVASRHSKINPFNAPGPGCLKRRMIISCAQQLSSMVTWCFIYSWTVSAARPVIIPEPNKSHAKDLNDFRSVALTPVLAKCLEGIVCHQLVHVIANQLDP